MPVYEFECPNCLHHFELKRSFQDASPVSCPRCHGGTRKLFSPVPIVFKGSGFYTTDYGSRGRGDTWHKPDATASKADAKPTDKPAGDAKE